MSYELTLQAKIYAALNGNLSYSVYDNVPEGAEYPYFTIGESVAVEFDTDNTVGQIASFTINCWSREYGRKQVKEMIGEVYDLLHLSRFTDTTYKFTECYYVQSTTYKDADGKTYNGVIEFKLHIEEI